VTSHSIARRAAFVAVLGALRRRKWPAVLTVALVGTGMAYNLFWVPVVRHMPLWALPGDIWGTYRSAHYIAWGALGSVYSGSTGLITFPGILLLLAPVAALTGHLGMTEAFPYPVPHPTAWFVLGPYEMVLGCTVLFACDALAQRLAVPAGRRILLSVAETVVLWPVLVFWGHPEDAVGVALAVYAMVFAFDDRWTGAGWLFGAAVVTQPLVLLVLPVLLARSGWRRAAPLLARSFVPSALLLTTPVLAQFHATTYSLVNQPNFPLIDHVTPWTALAPRLGGHGRSLMVAAGPGRIVAVLGACALGWWARRWRYRPEALVWAAAVAMALRCFTESVMDDYYVWPALALALVAVAPARRWRIGVCVVASIAVTVCAENHLAPWWSWWFVVTGGLVVSLLAPLLGRTSRVADVVPIPVSAAGEASVHERSAALAGAMQ